MLIEELSPYFINITKINDLCDVELKINDKFITSNKQIDIKPISHIKHEYKFMIPKENDKLFWCYYMIIYGEIEYQMQENKNILFEKNKKIELVMKMRNNKNIIKQYKLTTIADVETNLSSDRLLSLPVFFLLLIIEEKNIVYMKNKCFYKSFMNDSDIIYLINQNYGLCEINKKQFDKIKDENLEITSLSKPIKSMSAYKLDDLKYICNKLSIQREEKINKKDLYEQIVQYFSHF
jgi:hypothetical protein